MPLAVLLLRRGRLRGGRTLIGGRWLSRSRLLSCSRCRWSICFLRASKPPHSIADDKPQDDNYYNADCVISRASGHWPNSQLWLDNNPPVLHLYSSRAPPHTRDSSQDSSREIEGGGGEASTHLGAGEKLFSARIHAL